MSHYPGEERPPPKQWLKDFQTGGSIAPEYSVFLYDNYFEKENTCMYVVVPFTHLTVSVPASLVTLLPYLSVTMHLY